MIPSAGNPMSSSPTSVGEVRSTNATRSGAANGVVVVTSRTNSSSLSERLALLANELGRSDRDWTILAEGNCSARLDDDLFFVKASGVRMSAAEPDGFVPLSIRTILNLVDDPDISDVQVQEYFSSVASEFGGRRPSVEALLHAVCLALPGVTTLAHTHPIAVNSILCSHRPELLVEGALFPDQIVILGPNPLLFPYADPGLELARAVRAALIASPSPTPKVLYVQNHGMFALGANDAEALQVTEMAVKVARIIIGASTVSEPAFMSPADVIRIDTRPDERYRRSVLAFSSSVEPVAL